ncbi:MAG: P63C domain-containing protein [Bacilli bacterium]|nr:P63C domain-containing protein [Bacilli bacterium]
MENNILKATHFGKITIGEKELTCAVLEDGTRILSSTAMFKAFERARSPLNRDFIPGENLPVFMTANNLKPYVDGALGAGDTFSIKYIAKDKRILDGYKATILPTICDIFLQARQDKVLTPNQEPLAIVSEILVRSLSKVGIIALIDEATGYQEERERDELQKLLSLYVREEFLPWTRRFPLEFYTEMFRLKGWEYKGKAKFPLVGQYTNKYVYDVLPEAVLDELKKKNPLVKNKTNDNKFYRKYRFHQFLSENIGIPHLDKHLASVITLMKISDDWEQFEDMFNKWYFEDKDENEIESDNDPVE